MKHYTSIEQSKKLLELGLSSETADMYYCEEYIGENNDHFYTIPPRIGSTKYGNLPCWSLGALLEVMPPIVKFEEEYLPNLSAYLEYWQGKCNNCYCCSYQAEVTSGSIVEMQQFIADTPIEATYSMVVYLLENGFIKKESKTSGK